MIFCMPLAMAERNLNRSYEEVKRRTSDEVKMGGNAPCSPACLFDA